MKKILLLTAIVLTLSGYAQTDSLKVPAPAPTDSLVAPTPKKDTSYWKITGMAGLNFSQTTLINWAAGGENSIATNGAFALRANYNRGRYAWDNVFATEYGLMYTETYDWQKTLDKIDFASKFGYGVIEHWYLTFLLGFNTQYDKGYKKPDDEMYISKFMAPGYLNLSVGMDYKYKDIFTAYLSPIAGKLTFVEDDSLSALGSYGVEKGENLKKELGAYAKFGLKYNLMKNISLLSKLEFFTAYNESFGNVDINFEMLLNMVVNKYINAQIILNLKYDDDVKSVGRDGLPAGPKLQTKEMIGVGISYAF